MVVWRRAVLFLLWPVALTLIHQGSHSQEAMESGSGRIVASAVPVTFDSEVIKLFIEEDTLVVDGTYQLLCRPSDLEAMPLIYPFPKDSLLGEARMVLLEGRSPGGRWHPIPFEELPSYISAVRWLVPMDLGDTLQVRAVYHQALHDHYARYITTSTRAWGRPLRQARFEIYLPEHVSPIDFSFPFRADPVDGRNRFVYEVQDFLPDRDVIVRWKR
jgi:hypothetical protein